MTNNEKIMKKIFERLELGQERYNQNVPIMPIDDINRDNLKEACEEALDLSVYLAAFCLKMLEEND